MRRVKSVRTVKTAGVNGMVRLSKEDILNLEKRGRFFVTPLFSLTSKEDTGFKINLSLSNEGRGWSFEVQKEADWSPVEGKKIKNPQYLMKETEFLMLIANTPELYLEASFTVTDYQHANRNEYEVFFTDGAMVSDYCANIA